MHSESHLLGILTSKNDKGNHKHPIKMLIIIQQQPCDALAATLNPVAHFEAVVNHPMHQGNHISIKFPSNAFYASLTAPGAGENKIVAFWDKYKYCQPP